VRCVKVSGGCGNGGDLTIDDGGKKESLEAGVSVVSENDSIGSGCSSVGEMDIKSPVIGSFSREAL